MIRKFRVRVDGEVYDVEVEELAPGGAASTAAPQAAPAAPPAARAPEEPQVQAAAAAPRADSRPVDGEAVISPLPGVLLDLRVEVGDTVQEGQVVAILEAMKMENEITSPVSGTVVETPSKQGETVELGAVLAVIRP